MLILEKMKLNRYCQEPEIVEAIDVEIRRMPAGQGADLQSVT